MKNKSGKEKRSGKGNRNFFDQPPVVSRWALIKSAGISHMAVGFQNAKEIPTNIKLAKINPANITLESCRLRYAR